jgi:hypothetical protein
MRMAGPIICYCRGACIKRWRFVASMILAVATAQGAELLNADLYLSSSRCVRPLPRGFTGHVARPARSIRNMMLRNARRESTAVARERAWRKSRVDHIRVPGHHQLEKKNGTHQGLELFFRDRDHLIEKWETLRTDGTKTHFDFQLTRKSGSARM